MRTPRSASARTPARVLLGALVVLGSACVTSDADQVEAGSRAPLPTSSTVTDERGPLEVGMATTTRRGNTIAVLDAASGDGEVHALVEACAGPTAKEDVGVSLAFFALQLQDGTGLSPIEPSEAREPALRTLEVQPSSCTVGWLTFDVDDQLDEVGYLVFGSQTSSTRWDLRDLG